MSDKKHLIEHIKNVKLAIATNKTIIRWNDKPHEKDLARNRIKILEKKLKELEEKLGKEREVVL